MLVEDITRKIRQWRVDAEVANTLLYFLAALCFVGLVWFISFADSKHDMPESPPEEPLNEEEKKIMEEFDYESLVNKRQELDKDVVLKGSTDKYDWQQTKTEIDVFIKLPEEVEKAKDIKVEIKTGTLSIFFKGVLYMTGNFYDIVIPDECNWQIDNDSEERKLWLSLVKKNPSTRNQFWQSLLHGHPKVNTQPLGPSVLNIDPNKPESFKSAIDQIKLNAAAKQRAMAAEEADGKKDK